MSNEISFHGISDTITEFNCFSDGILEKSLLENFDRELEKPKTNVNLIWYSHGLWMPKWSFYFIKIPSFWALADNLADKFWGILAVFKWFISIHFGIVSPLFMFSINQLFLQTFISKSKIFIWGWDLGPKKLGI